jgi:hypothetical protein
MLDISLLAFYLGDADGIGLCAGWRIGPALSTTGYLNKKNKNDAVASFHVF